MLVSLQAMGMTRGGRMVYCFDELSIAPGGTVRSVAEAAGDDVVALVEANATLLLNGETARADSPVNEGDLLSIVLAVGGG